MSAFIQLNAEFVLYLKIRRRITPGRGSFREQATHTKMNVTIVDPSDDQASNMKTGKLAFQEATWFLSGIRLPVSELNMKDWTFWCFVSARRPERNGRARSSSQTCGSCDKCRISERCTNPSNSTSSMNQTIEIRGPSRISTTGAVANFEM